MSTEAPVQPDCSQECYPCRLPDRIEVDSITTHPISVAKTEKRPIASGSWQATFAGGIFKVLIAALALSLPLIEDRPLPLWVGAMLVAGGLAELAVGWAARNSVVGRITLASGAMTLLAGLIFMVAVQMGLAQLTVLTTIWLVLRGLISLRLALRRRESNAARVMLFVRGATDEALGVALVVGLSVYQFAYLLFGTTAAMATGFLVIVGVSFAIAGIGLVAIALTEWAWERRQRAAAVSE